MPPQKVRLHGTTGKHKTINRTAQLHPQPSTSQQNSPPPAPVNGNNEIQAELELCWCIQQLELSLSSGKLNEKQTQEHNKNVKILKNPTQPIIKKRQLMRTLFGDYRKKMTEEERKMYHINKNVAFTAQSSPNKSSYFVKKSALLTLGSEENFQFGFHLPAKELGEQLTDLTLEEQEHNVSSDSVCSTKQQSVYKFTAPPSTESEFRFNFSISDENCDDNEKK